MSAPAGLRIALAALALLAAAPAQEAPPWDLDRALLEAELARLADRSGPGVRLGVWVGDAEGRTACARAEDEVFPAASAIKTALLIELFARRAAELDRSPEALRALCDDADHAAWAPLAACPPGAPADRPAPRDDARRALRELSLFALGDAAIRGTAVPNSTYNAAGSALLALLGGPEAATRALHARSPRYRGLHLRRYFLAERAPGDNTATPRALAALLGDLARGAVPEMPREAADAARAVLLQRRDVEHGVLFAKDGALDSAPICRARSGFLVDRRGTWVWVLLACAEEHGAARGPELERLLAEAHETVLERVRLARAGTAAAFERRSGFTPEPEGAEALPVRSAGALVGARRLPAVVGARAGQRLAWLGPIEVEDALAIAADLGPEGRLEIAEERPQVQRWLAEAAAANGGAALLFAPLRRGRPAWAEPRAELALHAPRGVPAPAERSAAFESLASALAPGGIAVLWLDGAAVPPGAAERRQELGAWLDAARAAGFARGRLWRWPRGSSFALELRSPGG